ncbi:hypothetical protein FNH22_01030 [Fulvivirga sp. M361]|uniref:hypothetical protein n=1 Tax=Fulvivirga sp. M361 TaxID=2594266 RepID=UPI00117ABCC3|nr:hypothetical protein [Fulvivirga sp. M361]TRX62710.1 hypothetical protein FNH22_01030 [Fulvivirga sp. M361]
MGNKFVHIALVTMVWLTTSTLKAQQFPASVSAVSIPPNSVYFHDYFSTGSERLRLTLLFNDFNEPSRDVFLRFTLEGNGITISSKQDFVPSQTFTLVPGVPTMVTSSDLQEFADVSNLNFSGVSSDFLNQNGRLSEGLYSFCFEIVDLESGRVLSRRSCANVWVLLKDPPFMIAPIDGANIPPAEPLNVPFQWQLNNLNTPDGIFTTEYQLTVFEIEDPNSDPIVAINNGHALQIFQSEWVQQTQFIYDLSASQLDLGETYAYYVQARDTEGRELYKNNGISQVNSFTYGYSEGGTVELLAPENESSFKLGTPQSFSWEAPDNLGIGQQFVYYLKIVELEEGQEPEEAIEGNAIWYDYTSPTYASGTGANILLTQSLETNQEYAWQVQVRSGIQTTAASEVFTFKGPPLIEQFEAGDHIVTVTETTTNDLSSLNGNGVMAISEDGSETVEFEFEGLDIGEAGGLYYLRSGEVEHTLANIREIKVTTENELNGEATFYGSTIRITKNGLEVKGYVEWPFSHPVTSPDLAYVVSKEGWVNFDKFLPKGIVTLTEENNFELLDPFGYIIDLLETSSINLDYSSFTPTLNGTVTYPQGLVMGEEERDIVLPFELTDQLFYFDFSPDKLANNIRLVANTGIVLEPTSIIFDFSESESPEKKKNIPTWKGTYFETFNVRLDAAIDASDQIAFTETSLEEFVLDQFNTNKGWVDANGLSLSVLYKFLEEKEATFNSFPTVLRELSLTVVNSSVSESDFKGSIRLPLIDADKSYTYTIPITDSGFMEGYLDNDLNDSQFIYNPYGQENRMEITILRAVFRDNERLDMTLDIDIPYINASIPAISDFRLYGDYAIGFGERNGAKDLDNHVEGVYETFPMFIDQIGASLIAGRYAFSYGATMPLGDEVSGEEGPPRVMFHSISAGSDELENASLGSSADQAAMAPPISNTGVTPGNSKNLSIDSIQISVESAIASLSGYLIMTKNDPEWGTSLQGGIDGAIKIPSEIRMGAHMILGNKDNLKYWYFDAYYVDDGPGISVFNMFNLVGLEGKIYRHMSLDINEGGEAKPVIDPDIEFGAGMYIQLIDQSGGKTFMVDIGAEVVVSNEGFIVQMEGDISALNTQGRDMTAAGSLKKAVAEAVAEAATDAALDVVDNINVDIPIGSKTLSVGVSGDGGSLGYSDGDLNAEVFGEIAETPAVGVSFQKGQKKITVKGDVDANGSLLLEDGSNRLGLEVGASGKGDFDFAYDQVALSANIDIEERSAGFTAGYDQNSVEFLINQSESYQKLALISGTDWNALLELDEGKGTVGFGYDDYDITLSANKEATQGKIELSTPQFDLISALDKDTKTGLFDLEEGSNTIKLSGHENGGEIDVSYNNFDYYTSIDKSTGQGALSFGYGDDRKLSVEGNTSDEGQIGLDYDGNSFLLSTSKPDKKFDFDFENEEIGQLRIAYDGQLNNQLLGIRHGNDSILAYVTPDSSLLQVVHSENSFGIGVAGDGQFIEVGSKGYVGALKRYATGGGAVRLANGSEKSLFFEVNGASNTKRAELTYDGMLVSISNRDVTVSYQENTLTINTDKQVTFDLQGHEIQFVFDPNARYRVNITDAGNLLDLSLDRVGNVRETIRIDDVEVSFEIDQGNRYSIIYSQDGVTAGFSFDESGAAMVAFEGFGEKIIAAKSTDSYGLTLGDFSVTYAVGDAFTFALEDISVDLNGSGSVPLGNTGFSFGDGGALIYEKGSSPKISLVSTGLTIEKGAHYFNAQSSTLNYAYDEYSLSLTSSSAAIQQGDRSAAINFDGQDQGFIINDGDKSLSFKTDQVEYRDGDDTFAIGGEYYLSSTYQGKTIELDPDYIGFKTGNKEISFGGDNYIFFANEGDQFSVSKQKEVTLKKDDLAISVNSDKVISASKGEHIITLNDGERPIQYSNNEISTGLIAGGGSYGVAVGYSGVDVSLSTYKFSNATLAYSSDFGQIAITGNGSSNLEATFTKGDRTIKATTGNDGISFSDSNDEPVPEPPQVGTETPPMAGPQYIGKVTDGATGLITGHASLYFNSAERHFIANGSVVGTAPCLEGSFAIEASPQTWSIDIGSEEQRIEVYPTCSGFGGGGWLNLTPSRVNVGVFTGFKAGGSVKLDWGIGYAEIWAKIQAELGIRADADITPVFKINEVGIWVYLYAGLGVKYDIGIDSGNFTIAEAELKGTLLVNFENGTNVSGELSGRIKILGISGGFDLGFNEDL